MSDVIKFEKKGSVGIITIDNPPANAMSFAAKKGVSDYLNSCMTDDQYEAIIITGEGRIFVAGADISEFGKDTPAGVPELEDVIQNIENSDKPVIAAFNGMALGGGMELAMACHYRLATPAVKVGQPEVNLGFIPGGGGTQRLPRLVGVELALEMIVTGKPIDAAAALEAGAIDEIVDGDLMSRAIEFAEEKGKSGEEPRRTCFLDEKVKNVDPEIFDVWRKKISSKSRNMRAPFECINTVEASTTMDFNAGLKNERKVFDVLLTSSEGKSMRHMFFAEREVAKIPDVPKDTKTQDIKKAAVIGSGTMGGGIAMNFANAGIPVVVVDVDHSVLKVGLEKVKNNYAGSVSKGRISQENMDDCLGQISVTTDYNDIADVDIVIEAAFEDMDVKKKIFSQLDKICKSDAILATNTSTLNINEIAASTSRPDKVCGTHFFSPANVMKLLENVRTDKSSIETIATVMGLAKTLKKTGVLVGVGDGFVGNRILHVAARIAEFMVEEGALPWDIDKVIYDFGFPMGPFAMNDLAGIDVRYLVRQEQKKLYGDRRQSVILDRVYDTGRYGQKTNAGWYDYPDGSRKGEPNKLIEELIVKTSAELGYERRRFSEQEILETYLYSMINTGAKVLEEGLAIRSSDIDVIWHYGYGFPRYWGGPMFYADLIGLSEVYEKVCELNKKYGEWVVPSELLKKLAEEGKGFSDFKAD
ncbi:MAG: 3-hydroxyacyl-CoA dehydrogenase NAD-binding domain-containing protein [Pseudomonadota bacterium]|nr:3-hydroxyacyl-CoA dehydrogenase NAD-binding domain-containing protein [Pseudomonadota bacterium]